MDIYGHWERAERKLQAAKMEGVFPVEPGPYPTRTLSDFFARDDDSGKSAPEQAFGDGPGRDRTCDLGIKSPLLYQLSYRPACPRRDSNPCYSLERAVT